MLPLGYAYARMHLRFKSQHMRLFVYKIVAATDTEYVTAFCLTHYYLLLFMNIILMNLLNCTVFTQHTNNSCKSTTG